eukprot:g27972.t1
MKFCHAYSLSQEERRLSPERLKALLRPRRKKFRKDLITTLTAELEKQGFKNVKLLAESRHDRFAADSGEFYVHDALQRMGYNSFMRLWVNEFPRHSLEKGVQAVNLARPDLRRRDTFPYQTDATRDVPGALPPNHRERLVKSGAVVTADSEEGKRLLEGHRNFRPWPENKPRVLLPKDPSVGDFCPKFAKVNMMTAELPDGSKRQIAVKLIEKAYDKTLHVLTIGCSNTNPVGNKASQIVASDDPNIHQNFRQESFANQGYTRFEISCYTHPLTWSPSGSELKRALDDLENAVCDAKSLVQSSISTNIDKLYASRKSVTLWIDIMRCQVWLDWWKAGRRVIALPVWRRSFKESLTTMLKNVAALIGELPLRVVFTTYNLRSPEGNVIRGPSLDLALDRWMENYTTAGELKNPKYGYYRVEDIECGAAALCLAQASSTAAPQVFTRTGYAFEVEPRLTKQLARHNMEPKNNSKLMGLSWTICLSADECKQVRSLKLHELFRRNEASLEAWCKSLQQARLPGKGSSLNGMQGLPVSVGLPISEFKTRDLKDIEAGVYILVLVERRFFAGKWIALALIQQENCPGVKVRVPENVGQDLHNHLNTAASGPKKI